MPLPHWLTRRKKSLLLGSGAAVSAAMPLSILSASGILLIPALSGVITTGLVVFSGVLAAGVVLTGALLVLEKVINQLFNNPKMGRSCALLLLTLSTLGTGLLGGLHAANLLHVAPMLAGFSVLPLGGVLGIISLGILATVGIALTLAIIGKVVHTLHTNWPRNTTPPARVRRRVSIAKSASDLSESQSTETSSLSESDISSSTNSRAHGNVSPTNPAAGALALHTLPTSTPPPIRPRRPMARENAPDDIATFRAQLPELLFSAIRDRLPKGTDLTAQWKLDKPQVKAFLGEFTSCVQNYLQQNPGQQDVIQDVVEKHFKQALQGLRARYHPDIHGANRPLQKILSLFSNSDRLWKRLSPVTFQDMVRQLNKDIRELQQAFKKIRKEQASIEKGFDNVREGFDNVREGFDNVREGHAKIRKDQASIRKDLEGKHRRLDVLEDKMRQASAKMEKNAVQLADLKKTTQPSQPLPEKSVLHQSEAFSSISLEPEVIKEKKSMVNTQQHLSSSSQSDEKSGSSPNIPSSASSNTDVSKSVEKMSKPKPSHAKSSTMWGHADARTRSDKSSATKTPKTLILPKEKTPQPSKTEPVLKEDPTGGVNSPALVI